MLLGAKFEEGEMERKIVSLRYSLLGEGALGFFQSVRRRRCSPWSA